MSESSEERDEFVEIYLEESVEQIEQLVKLLLQLEEDPTNVEALREAFRLLHTFKGSSGMMGFERINALAHELETRFDACRNGREQLTTEAVSVVLRCVDFFRDFLDRLEQRNEDQGDPTPLIQELASIGALPRSDSSSSATIGEEPTPAPGETESAAETESAKKDVGAEDQEAAPTPAPPSQPEPSATDETAEEEPVRPSTEPEPRVSEAPAAVEPAPRSTPKVDPVVASTEIRPVREITVHVRLSDRIELPDLKARLIVARLQAQGDVLDVQPTMESIEQAPPPITLQVRMRSAADAQSLSESLDIDGVAAVDVKEASAETEPEKEAGPNQGAESPTPQPSPAKPPPPGPARRSGETIRVGIDRLDRLMNLAGELVVTNARFDQLADEMRLLFRSGGSIEAGSPLAESLLRAMNQFGSESPTDEASADPPRQASVISGMVGTDGGSEEGAALRRGWMDRGRRVAGQVSETVDQLARLSRSIQQAVLETRMVPIGPMFNRFRRTVRDISMKQKKQVGLALEGEMTELDKRMVDELGDPMIHLIRNALDHGIESPEDRVRAGKSPDGLVRLRAYHQSNHVVIEIEDDGAGIDPDKVRRRALDRGLATESELNMMTDTEVYGYIWHAGFSTAETVSDISGRGVGMDVVRDRIAALGGVVELSSQPGIGSTVSIRLPLTLSIVNAMIVRFRGFRLAIPVTDVFEIYGLSHSEIFESQGREMIDVRGRLLPLYRLDELFQWNDYLPPHSRRREGLVQAVLVRHGHRSLAIEVDDLDGNSDIVIKSLDEHFSHIPGVGGACVMGDGEVCLVLDTASLELGNSKSEAGEIL